MRTMRMMRTPSAAQLLAGVLIFALPSSAYALTQGPAPAPSRVVHAHLRARPQRTTIRYGDDAVVTGSGSARAPGASVTLQYEAAGSRRWRPLAASNPTGRGRFRFRARMRRSGLIRVVETTRRLDAQADKALPGMRRVMGRSTPWRIAVDAEFHVAERTIEAVAGRPVELSGRLLPGVAGRIVQLRAPAGRGSTTIAQARTTSTGDFSLRFVLPTAGTRSLSVSFPGDRLNLPASAGAGQAVALTEAVASWYYDGGATACGFHATYGVANRTLPCGTHVTLSYGGRTVTATVDDRGPYVYGREFDLNQNTAAALGMFGVATVLTSV